MPRLGAKMRIVAASLAAAIVAICVLVVVILFPSGGNDGEFRVMPPDGGYPFATFAPAVDFVPAGDVHPISYLRAVPTENGDYAPPESPVEPSELLLTQGFSRFDGDDANGIRLVSSLKEISDFRNVCGDQDYWKFEEYDGLSYEWLPGGTYRFEPQQVAVCPDGSVATIFDSMEADWGRLEIQYFVGDRVLWHQAGDRYQGEMGAGLPLW